MDKTTVPYHKIKDTARITGLSASLLRKGCRDGTIPHIVFGNAYYIDLNALLHNLQATAGGDNHCDPQ